MQIIRKRNEKKTPSIKWNATAITAHHHHHHHHTRQQRGTQSNYVCAYRFQKCLLLLLLLLLDHNSFFTRVFPSEIPIFICISFDALQYPARKKRLFDSICFEWTFVLNDAYEDATTTTAAATKWTMHPQLH